MHSTVVHKRGSAVPVAAAKIDVGMATTVKVATVRLPCHTVEKSRTYREPV